MNDLFWRTKKFLSYKVFSKHRKGHGIHSPFVYNLVRNVFLDNVRIDDFDIVEKYRCELNNSRTEIEIKDLGAGSKSLRGTTRKIKDIVRVSSVSKKYGELLYKLVKYLNSNTILELGTSVGISTQYLALANTKSKVISIESNYQLIDIVLKQFKKLGIQNAKIVEGNFDQALETVLSETEKLDFVFIDGNHSKEATLRYFELIKPNLHNNSCIIFDDIYWSKGMYEAWNEMKRDEYVSVTIDIFQFGIVFFREESSKENFVIKF
jgi:predicted O-methyltransferase YrrM